MSLLTTAVSTECNSNLQTTDDAMGNISISIHHTGVKW